MTRKSFPGQLRPAPTLPRPTPAWATAACALLLTLLGALAPAASAAPAVPAASSVEEVANALREDPVYVDSRARDQLPTEAADNLRVQIEGADKPVFVAVLPTDQDFPPDSLLQDLRSRTGIAGIYAVVLGDTFDAGADRTVMTPRAVSQLTSSVERAHDTDTAPLLGDFVDQAVQQADGTAPGSWSGADAGRGSGGLALLTVLGALVVLGLAAGLLVSRRNRRRQAERQRTELDRLRPMVDEDITAFGEELHRIDFDPGAPESDDAARQDYASALDSYEHAKSSMAAARRPEDVRQVSEALADGRFALSVVDARRAGKPLPERRPPCFFDPRHGPSVADRPWEPPDGTERQVPVCAADQTRLAEGREPMSRTVDTPQGRRPYWEAGGVYAPWASGYFGGGLLPGLMVGTLLGGALAPGYGYGYEAGGAAGGAEGGDYTGSDFDSGDFGGGGGDLGGGGGDFGGGGGF